MGDEISPVEIFREGRPKENAASYVGADPVVENDRVTQDGAKILVLRSHVQEVTICKGNNGGAVMLKSSIKQSHRLCCRTDRNRDTQNVPRLCTTKIFI